MRPSKTKRARKNNRNSESKRNFQPKLQHLETRQLMAGDVDFGHLADRLETRMLSLNSAVNAVQTATKLPLVGNMFQGQNNFVDMSGGVTQEIADELRNLPSGADATTIQNALADRLMQVDYLGDHNGDGVINHNDVVVTVDHNQSDIDIETRLTTGTSAYQQHALDFDIGLDQVPLRLSANGDVQLEVGIDYENFKFGLDNGVFELDTSNTDELKIHLLAGLRNQSLSGQLGFLEFSASQQDAPGASPTQLNATMNIDVTPTGMDWSIDAVADVHLDLYAGIAGMSQTAPSVGADFDFHWDFENLTAGQGLRGVTAAPSLQLNNVRIKLGQVLSDVVRPWLSEVQKVTAPLQPIVDVLNSPIPGLSDLSNLVGQGDITLIDLATAWGDYTTGDGVQWPDRHAAMQQESISLLRTAITITEVVDVINSLSPDAKNLEIVLGSYEVLGNGSGDIRNSTAAVVQTATNAIGSKLGIRKLEEFNVVETLNNVVGSQKDAADELKDSAVSIDADYKLQTPMFTGTPWAMMLLGQESDLVRFDADLQIDIDKKIPFVNFFGLGVGLDTDLDFDAQIGIGFDTRGFLDSTLLEGFYIDTHSFAEFSGSASLYAGFDIGIASATVNGGISTAGGKVRLEFGDDVIDGKLRPSEIANLSLGELFVTSGRIDVDASLRAEFGVDTPFGFIGTSKEYVFARHTILDLNRDIANGNPWQPPANPHLGHVDSTGALILHVGDQSAFTNPRTVGVGKINENYRVEQIDGTAGNATIRVHAFGAVEEFKNVSRIFADAGRGDDRISIESSVLTDVELYGGDGADQLIAQGRGFSRLSGGDGNDRIEVRNATTNVLGDSGDDHIRLLSGSGGFVYGGSGRDTIYGGDEAAELFGGDGDDLMFAGDGDGRLFGGRGNDVIELGSGESIVFAGMGDNRVLWEVTDGNAQVDAVGNTTVEITGTRFEDEIIVTGDGPAQSHHHVGSIHVESTRNQSRLDVSLLTSGHETEEELGTINGADVQTHLRIEGGHGADRVEVGYMGGSGLTSLAVNVAQLLDPDAAEDQIHLSGSAGNDYVTVDQQEYYSSVTDDLKNPEGGKLYGPLIAGGLMSVQGLHDYSAYVANANDLLEIHLDAGHDVTDVMGTTGPTVISGADGLDQLNVRADQVTDLLGPIDFRGGSGSNVVRLNMTGLNEDVRLDVNDSSITGSMIEVDELGVPSSYPVDIVFSNDGGSLRNVDVRTGDGADEVTLGNNFSRSPIRVNTGHGDDDIFVGWANFGPASTTGYEVYGGSGSNALHAARFNNDWHVTSSRGVSLNGTPFQHIDHMSGSTLADNYRFADGVYFAGTLNGSAGRNTLDYSAWTSDVVVNLMWGEASNVNGNRVRGVLNIQDFVGGSGNDLFVGNHVANQATGGAGRDVLIGGMGADELDGGADEDLLISERYAYDRDRVRLSQISADWGAHADPARASNLVDAVYMLDDGEIDKLISDPADVLF